MKFSENLVLESKCQVLNAGLSSDVVMTHECHLLSQISAEIWIFHRPWSNFAFSPIFAFSPKSPIFNQIPNFSLNSGFFAKLSIFRTKYRFLVKLHRLFQFIRVPLDYFHLNSQFSDMEIPSPDPNSPLKNKVIRIQQCPLVHCQSIHRFFQRNPKNIERRC